MYAYHFGAHHEGFKRINIAHHSHNTCSSDNRRTLREELIRAFQNPADLEDTSIFVEQDIGLQRHHYLSPPNSPFFTPADLPLPSRNPYLSGYLSDFHTPPNTPEPILVLQQLPVTHQVQQSRTNMTQPAFEMPLRNERTAPTFDSSKPRELPCFFKDLEQLFKRAGLQKAQPTQADEQLMKEHAVNYVDYATEQIWKSIPEYDPINLKTY